MKKSAKDPCYLFSKTSKERTAQPISLQTQLYVASAFTQLDQSSGNINTAKLSSRW